MLLYILAGIGVLALLIVLLILLMLLFGWMGQPVRYLVRADEVQRYLASWGSAIAEGGKILVQQPGTERFVTFVKRHQRRGEHLVFRLRNADATRRHFESVESAFRTSSIPFDVEKTPRGRPRAIVIQFRLGDPLMLSAAAHAARVALTTMGAEADGPFEMTCHGTHRPDYVRGSVEVIPWTRGYRAGHLTGQFFARFWWRV
jgi:hypothetical protein